MHVSPSDKTHLKIRCQRTNFILQKDQTKRPDEKSPEYQHNLQENRPAFFHRSSILPMKIVFSLLAYPPTLFFVLGVGVHHKSEIVIQHFFLVVQTRSSLARLKNDPADTKRASRPHCTHSTYRITSLSLPMITLSPRVPAGLTWKATRSSVLRQLPPVSSATTSSLLCPRCCCPCC